MICNFFEFKFIQFKNKYYRIKKSIDRDAFFVYIYWHFVYYFFELYSGSSFFIYSFDSQKNLTKIFFQKIYFNRGKKFACYK